MFVFLAAAAILWSGAATGQQSAVPKLTQAQVEQLVSNKVPDSTLSTQIQRRGLDFAPTAAIVESLRAKGAGPLTLETIEALLPKGTPGAVVSRAQITAPSAGWIDPATGMMWTKSDNGADVDWNQSRNYCANLHLGGYSDWRLPTLDELQGIYDPNVNLPVTCCGGISVTWHVKGNLQLSGAHWSNTPGDASGEAWRFYFNVRKRSSTRLDYSNHTRVLCVRRSAE
jgi:hypothetical protein